LIRKGTEYPDPVLKSIAECYDEFLVGFTKKDNFKKCYILDNEAFTLGIRKKQTLTINNFYGGGAGENGPVPNLYALTLEDIIEGENIRNQAELEGILGMNITRQLYRDLTGLVQASFTKYGKSNIRGVTVKTFFGSFKKGSKKIRKYIEQKKNDFIPHNIVKFSKNTDTVVGLEASKTLNSLWLAYFLSNETRTFHFKLVNNILGVNYIIYHFVPGVERNCTICDLTGNQELEDETPLHLFYSCSTVENLLYDFFEEIGTVITRTEYFSLPARENKTQNMVILWLSLVIKKYIWDCKMRRCVPELDALKYCVYKEFKTMSNVCNFVRSSIKNSNLSYVFISGCVGNF
jgi:hypothetical protein